MNSSGIIVLMSHSLGNAAPMMVLPTGSKNAPGWQSNRSASRRSCCDGRSHRPRSMCPICLAVTPSHVATCTCVKPRDVRMSAMRRPNPPSWRSRAAPPRVDQPLQVRKFSRTIITTPPFWQCGCPARRRGEHGGALYRTTNDYWPLRFGKVLHLEWYAGVRLLSAEIHDSFVNLRVALHACRFSLVPL